MLLNADAAFTGDKTSPIHLAATEDGQFLYVLKSAIGDNCRLIRLTEPA